MTKRLKRGISIVTLAIGATLVGCGAISDLFNESTEQLSLQSSLDGVDSAVNEVEESLPAASFGLSPHAGGKRLLSPWRQANACIMANLDPEYGSDDCSGAEEGRILQSQFELCRSGKKAFKGDVTLSFDASATCDQWISGSFPTSGELLREVEHIYAARRQGRKYKLHSKVIQNYLGEDIGGGVRTVFQDGQREVHILGLNRLVGHRNENERVARRSQSISTLDPLVLSGTLKGGDRKIVSGVVRVDHNKQGFSSTTTYDNVAWGADCCYPISGTVSMEYTGARTGTRVAQFSSTCGLVNIVKDGIAQEPVQMDACEESDPDAEEGDEGEDLGVELE